MSRFPSRAPPAKSIISSPTPEAPAPLTDSWLRRRRKKVSTSMSPLCTAPRKAHCPAPARHVSWLASPIHPFHPPITTLRARPCGGPNFGRCQLRQRSLLAPPLSLAPLFDCLANGPVFWFRHDGPCLLKTCRDERSRTAVRADTEQQSTAEQRPGPACQHFKRPAFVRRLCGYQGPRTLPHCSHLDAIPAIARGCNGTRVNTPTTAQPNQS